MRPKRVRCFRGAGCLLHRTDENGNTWVFLGCRRYRPGKGHWSVPGGAAHERTRDRARETFWETARRETLEETGIDPSYLVPPPEKAWPSIWIELPGFRWRTFLVAVNQTYDPRTSHEFSETGWYQTEELPRPLHFGMKIALRRLRRLIKRSPRI